MQKFLAILICTLGVVDRRVNPPQHELGKANRFEVMCAFHYASFGNIPAASISSSIREVPIFPRHFSCFHPIARHPPPSSMRNMPRRRRAVQSGASARTQLDRTATQTARRRIERRCRRGPVRSVLDRRHTSVRLPPRFDQRTASFSLSSSSPSSSSSSSSSSSLVRSVGESSLATTQSLPILCALLHRDGEHIALQRHGSSKTNDLYRKKKKKKCRKQT